MIPCSWSQLMGIWMGIALANGLEPSTLRLHRGCLLVRKTWRQTRPIHQGSWLRAWTQWAWSHQCPSVVFQQMATTLCIAHQSPLSDYLMVDVYKGAVNCHLSKGTVAGYMVIILRKPSLGCQSDLMMSWDCLPILEMAAMELSENCRLCPVFTPLSLPKTACAVTAEKVCTVFHSMNNIATQHKLANSTPRLFLRRCRSCDT